MKPFHPVAGATVNLNATTTSSSILLGGVPTGAFQVRAYNGGPSTAFLAFGDATAAATIAGFPLPAGAIEVITLQNRLDGPIDHVAAITASGTAALYFTSGEGL